MNYILKQYDDNLIRFSMSIDNLNGLEVCLLDSDEGKKHIFPLDLELSNKGIEKWLKKRLIPKNRAFVHEILKTLGLSHNDTKGIVDVCKGLSLNDSYWIVPESFTGKFVDYNLYENKFARVLSLVAYTGIPGGKTPFTTSPELTTNGALPKAWRVYKNKICLFKAGSEGAANTGNEPYSEFYAYQIAKSMNLNAIPYDLAIWKKKLSSYCELFTDINTSFIPIGRIVTEGGLKAVLEYYQSLGDEFYQEISSMLVFDALVFNDDRHFGNFGLLRDNHSGEIIKPAPIFDNGVSLFNYAMPDDFKDLVVYSKDRKSASGADHLEIAKTVMGKKQKEQLRHLFGFKFIKHSSYNLPQQRLNSLEKFINQRLKELIQI